MIQSFQDLEVYSKVQELNPELIIKLRKFPKEGDYLVRQISRAANSIKANIAEGYGRSEAEFKKFLTSSLGSNNEVLSHLEDCLALGYLSKGEFDHFFEEYTVVGKQLYRLKERWKKLN